jgi:hypothetical protein
VDIVAEGADLIKVAVVAEATKAAVVTRGTGVVIDPFYTSTIPSNFGYI